MEEGEGGRFAVGDEVSGLTSVCARECGFIRFKDRHCSVGGGKKSTQKREIYIMDLSFTVIFLNDLIKRGTNTSCLVLSGATMEE